MTFPIAMAIPYTSKIMATTLSLNPVTYWSNGESELKRLMPNITQKMLTQQLRELEEDGVINRIVYHEIPPKVEYELSEYGKSLEHILDALCAWGESHLTQVYGDKNEVLEEGILNNKK